MPRGQTESQQRGQSRRGFAAMNKTERKRIAAMGGHASHGGGRSQQDQDEGYDDDSRSRSSGGRGFAGMDPEEQRRISQMGGRASHGGRGSYERDYDYDEDYEPSRGRSSGRRSR